MSYVSGCIHVVYHWNILLFLFVLNIDAFKTILYQD